MDGNFLDQAERLAVGGFEVLQIGPEDVVGLPRGNALGKLAIVIGKELPSGFLILGTPDLYCDAVDRTVVRSPDCSENKGVRLFRLGVLRRAWAGNDYQKNDQEGDQAEREGIRPCGVGAQAEFMSSHRLRFLPPLLLPLHSLLPRPSTQADW